MSPIASEWLMLALKDAREEIAAWPEWLRAGANPEAKCGPERGETTPVQGEPPKPEGNAETHR